MVYNIIKCIPIALQCLLYSAHNIHYIQHSECELFNIQFAFRQIKLK